MQNSYIKSKFSKIVPFLFVDKVMLKISVFELDKLNLSLSRESSTNIMKIKLIYVYLATLVP